MLPKGRSRRYPPGTGCSCWGRISVCASASCRQEHPCGQTGVVERDLVAGKWYALCRVRCGRCYSPVPTGRLAVVAPIRENLGALHPRPRCRRSPPGRPWSIPVSRSISVSGMPRVRPRGAHLIAAWIRLAPCKKSRDRAFAFASLKQVHPSGYRGVVLASFY